MDWQINILALYDVRAFYIEILCWNIEVSKENNHRIYPIRATYDNDDLPIEAIRFFSQLYQLILAS